MRKVLYTYAYYTYVNALPNCLHIKHGEVIPVIPNLEGWAGQLPCLPQSKTNKQQQQQQNKDNKTQSKIVYNISTYNM